MPALTPKQKKFADEWLIDHNSTRAALAAKYSKKTAGSQGSRLLKNVDIKKYIKAKQDVLAKKADISQERVMKEIGRVAFADIRKYFTGKNNMIPVTSLDDEAAAALAGVEVDELYHGSEGGKYWVGQTKKIKLNDKMKALEMLAKHFGIYRDGAGDVNLNLQIGYGKEEPV